MKPTTWLERAMAGKWRPAIVGGTPIKPGAHTPVAPTPERREPVARRVVARVA